MPPAIAPFGDPYAQWAEESCRITAEPGFYPSGHRISQAYVDAELPLAELPEYLEQAAGLSGASAAQRAMKWRIRIGMSSRRVMRGGTAIGTATYGYDSATGLPTTVTAGSSTAISAPWLRKNSLDASAATGRAPIGVTSGVWPVSQIRRKAGGFRTD